MTTASKPWYCRSSRVKSRPGARLEPSSGPGRARVDAGVLRVSGGEVAPEALVADDLPAEAAHALVLGLEDLDLRQAVLGDAVAEHPAGGRLALEARGVVAGEEEVVGRGQAGRPGADDRRLAAGGRLLLERDRRV